MQNLKEIVYKVDDKYENIIQLGSGHFGAVYSVHDKILKKQVALKVVNDATEDTFKEAQAGNLVTHANLVKIHSAEFLKDQEKLLITMDYCQNGSIAKKFNSANFIPLSQALQYIKDILRGLEALHGVSIFHNDIKPHNILLGDNQEAILTDYGIAMLSNGKQPIEADQFYRPHCAPETLNNKCICITTDIYQAGLTLFRLINGCDILTNKFQSVGPDEYNKLILANKLVTSKDYLDFVPRQLKTIINKAINKDPDNRYPTAREMRHALEQVKIKGEWTVDSSGNYEGSDDKNIYSFDEEPCGHNLYNFKAFKQSKKSQRKTQIHKYAKDKAKKIDIEKTRKKFMTDVVNGGIK